MAAESELNNGQRVTQLRMALGMTQEELAKRCGYKSRSSINKIELGRPIPKCKLAEFAKVFGLSSVEGPGSTDCRDATIKRIVDDLQKLPIQKIDAARIIVHQFAL